MINSEFGMRNSELPWVYALIFNYTVKNIKENSPAAYCFDALLYSNIMYKPFACFGKTEQRNSH